MARPVTLRQVADGINEAAANVNRGKALPLVSIAMCVYNGEKYLREQLDSLVAQSHQNIEIVAVDDGSTDGSLALLEAYSRHEPRLRVYANGQNVGLRCNFDIAVSHCRGEFIAPCDQDDIWMTDKIEVLLQAIHCHALVYCNSALIDENALPLNKNISDLVSMLSTEDPTNLLFHNCASGHAMLFRRSLLNYARPFPDVFLHDWWLATVATTVGGIHFIDAPLVRYRQHIGSTTNILKDRQASSMHKAPGYRLQALRLIGRRLELLAKLPGRHQPMINKLKKMWMDRENQWISPGLTMCMARNGRRLFATDRRATFLFRLRRALYCFWGIRTKRIVNPDAFLSVDTKGS